MSQYIYIVQFDDLANHFGIDVLEDDHEFDSVEGFDLKKFNSKLQNKDSQLLLIAKYSGEKWSSTRGEPIGFDSTTKDLLSLSITNKNATFFEQELARYQSNFGESIYKIERKKALALVSRGRHIYFVKEDLRNELIDSQKELQIFTEERIKNINDPPSAGNEFVQLAMVEFKRLEFEWTNYWKESFSKFLTFQKTNPYPQLSDVKFPFGTQSLFPQKAKSELDEKKKSYWDGANKLVSNIFHNASIHNKRIMLLCPGDCGELVHYTLSIPYTEIKEVVKNNAKRKIHSFVSSCESCGNFIIFKSTPQKEIYSHIYSINKEFINDDVSEDIFWEIVNAFGKYKYFEKVIFFEGAEIDMRETYK